MSALCQKLIIDKQDQQYKFKDLAIKYFAMILHKPMPI